MFSKIFFKKAHDSRGAGLPRGLLMEAQAILLVVLVIFAGFVVWWGTQQMERHDYLDGSKPERISTAAGKPGRP